MSDHQTENNVVYLLDLVVCAALESRQPGHENALTATMDQYQLEIDDNIVLWRNLVEVAAIQIASQAIQFLGIADATEMARNNVDSYLERD